MCLIPLQPRDIGPKGSGRLSVPSSLLPFCPVFLFVFFYFCFLSRRMNFKTGLSLSSTSSLSLLFILCPAGFPATLWTLHPSTLPLPLPFAGEQICHTPYLQIHWAWLICLIYNWCLNWIIGFNSSLGAWSKESPEGLSQEYKENVWSGVRSTGLERWG